MEHISELMALEERAAKQGLTLDALARRAGVVRSSVWKWRNGKNVPLHTKFTSSMATMTDCLARLEAAQPAQSEAP
jgi:transposase-like protein